MGPRADASAITGLQARAGNRAVQRLVVSTLGEVDGKAISDRIATAEGRGVALEAGVARLVAKALGADPGDVRIHTDGEADALSQAVGAKAFTSGRDVFFRHGAFEPSTPEGFALLVHESTHVLQQAAGPVDGTPTADGALSISDPGDAFEQAAQAHSGDGPAPATGPGGRAVQRDDDWSLGSIVNDVESGANTALGVVNSPFHQAAANIDKATSAYGDFVGMQEDLEHDVVHRAADAVSDVPVLGTFAQTTAGTVDMATQLIGGFQEGAVDIVGGMVKTVVDPIDAAKGVMNLTQRLPPAVMANAGAQAIGDLVVGNGLDKAESDIGQGLVGSVDSVWGGITEGADPRHPGQLPKDAGLVRQILDPFYGDVAKGKGAHAVGRGAANVGALLFGGELGEAAEGALGDGVPTPGAEPLPEEPPATIREDPDQPPTTLRNDPDLAPPTVDERVPAIPARNPQFAEPGSPGFIEQADPFADTQPPRTLPGVGPEPETPTPVEPEPLTRRDAAPPTFREAPPSTLRDGAAPDANIPNDRAISPAAQSVPGTGQPAGPLGEPLPEPSGPISEAPATPNPDEIANAQDEFEKAWRAFSNEPFGYSLLPGYGL